MAASYPTTTKSFTTKLAAQTVASAHVNDLQDEVVAIEAALRGTLAHALTPDGDVTRALGSNAARWLHPAGTAAAPGVPVSETDIGLYSSGTNALDFATNGVKALGIDSTQFIDSPTQPRARAFNSATQSIATGTLTPVTFDSEDYDVGGLHSTGANTSRLTIPTGGDGLYLLLGRIYYALSASGVARLARLTINGASTNAGSQTTATPTTTNQMVTVVGLLSLAAADYVELYAYQDSGGNLNIGSATRVDSCELAIVKLW